MSNTVLLRIKPVYVSNNTFDKVDKLVNGAKSKVDALNNSYRTQGKTIGQLKEKIVEWRKESDNSYRIDHIKKYNQLIAGTKEKIEELERSAEACGEKTQSIFKSVFGANLLLKGIGVVKNTVVGFTKNSMDAYQKHNVALTQLEQVMKNTMNAGKWDVKDVVAVTKAQEKLGVVSSSVQLAGAKELATYIKKKDSLEKLLPTMNNMLAHQYGLNASQENAYGIAQMMGKVLEGQTGALQRNGYWFTEAQEKVLQYGTENERVATLLEVVEQSMKGVNEALAATPEGKAKQIAMEYDEVKIRIGELATKLKGDVSNSLMKFTLRLYDNRKLIVGVSKAVGSGVATWVAYKTTMIAVNSWTRKTGVLFAAKTFGVKLFTGQLKLATIQMATFNAISKMNPIGAGIGTIMAVASALMFFRKRGKETTAEMEKAREAYSSFYAQERTQLDTIFAKLRQTNPKSEERKRLVRELAELYPELNKQTLNDIANTNNLAGAYDTLIASIQRKAKAKAYESALEAAYQKGQEGEDILRKIYPNYTEAQIVNAAKTIVDNKNKHGWLSTKHSLAGLVSKSDYKKIETLVNSRNEASRISGILGENLLGGDITNNTNNNIINPKSYTSTASDSITGGGKQVKNFYINIGSLIGENTNMFQSSNDDPQSAQDFMGKLSEALQRVVNDANYAAA
ncbi:MAG: hypothetical protein FWC34_11110 [Bacteroidetes bacterium]|nr:hypothetical protein [Bacteroidota bacterium]MCL2302909.1 hypothetical protein [Lentimicrobiaceae bacterium]